MPAALSNMSSILSLLTVLELLRFSSQQSTKSHNMTMKPDVKEFVFVESRRKKEF